MAAVEIEGKGGWGMQFNMELERLKLEVLSALIDEGLTIGQIRLWIRGLEAALEDVIIKRSGQSSTSVNSQE
ncbi:MAG TPA: hypothetical protein GX513_12965 [Firmicutes bacterium]|nr:hypothetical protein [Bacillota bacterium]